LRVVIADDEPDIRLLLGVQLEQAGFDVVGEAGDGHETLALCEGKEPDVLVLDLLMPRMDGLELIPRLRAVLPELGIVAHTAVAGDFVRREMRRLRIPLVPKSADVRPLVDALRGQASRSAGL
jgi:CheY-like chemotaxis protein